MTSQKLSIPSMKCGGCVSTVEKTLKAITNVNNVVVDLESKEVTIEGDIDITILITAVTESGFPAEQV
ncbi:MAG: heavy-metal-associated domain-containing protein [Thiohalomonadales bacterium]